MTLEGRMSLNAIAISIYKSFKTEDDIW